MTGAFTYNGDPTDSDVSQIRFLVGDTVQTVFSLSDAEVQFTVDQSRGGDGKPRYREAGALACEAIATRYAKEATKNKRIGDIQIASDYTVAADEFLKLADRLRSMAGGNAVLGFTFMAMDPTTGLPADPEFSVGMDDNQFPLGSNADPISDFDSDF